MYAIINQEEITKLAGASGAVWSVYAVLCLHSQNKASCFPSVSRIASILDGALTSRSIQRALKWLEDNGIIKRQNRRSKQRFLMSFRTLLLKIKGILGTEDSQTELSSTKRQKRPHKKTRTKKKKSFRQSLGFSLPVRQKTLDDLKEEHLGRFIVTGEKHPDLVGLLQETDYDWMRQYHPQRLNEL